MAMALAVFIAALMIVSVAAAIIMSVMPQAQAAVTQDDIKKLKENKKALEAEKKRIAGDIQKLKAEKADAVAQKAAIDQQINIINLEVENTSQLITELTVAIAERQAELDLAMQEEAEATERFRKRVRVMEEAGSATYLSILFQSKSFSDLLDRWEMINEIIGYDQSLMDDLAKQKADIEEAKQQLEADKQDQLQNRKELDLIQAELAEQYGAADQLIAGLMQDLIDKEELYNQEVEAERQANEEIKKAEEEFKKQQEAAKKNTSFVGGVFAWPAPGYEGNITSPFGMRKHPILKVNKFHTGIDIGAPKNTKIVAANSGTVIVATYNSGYGNYLVVDHGGGYTTLYAHQTKFASGVKVGTQVAKGDTIGYVGSTGMSTGPHLHFEVRIKGEYQDPTGYVMKK